MKLWQVGNGYMGNGPVHVLVIAETEEEARAEAAKSFKEEADSRADNPTAAYSDDYWDYNELRATVLCEDVRSQWRSKVRD